MPQGTTSSFQVLVPEHYSRIYQANCNKIGLLNKSLAAQIVRFHNLIDAVVQDVKPGGALNDGATLPVFVETRDILSEAIELGYNIVNNTLQSVQAGRCYAAPLNTTLIITHNYDELTELNISIASI